MIQDIYPHRLHNEFRPGLVPLDDDFVYWFAGERVLFREDGEKVALPSAGEVRKALPGAELTFLFSLDGKNFFLYRGEMAMDTEEPVPGYRFGEFRALRQQGLGPRQRMFALTTAMQLSHWYRGNRFCGRCGEKTVPGEKERSLICPGCGNTIYPRIVPAVIVAVINGDSLLLTKYRGRAISYYALVAGFTEIGETLEETVQREVMEEAGIRVKNIRYYKSQPWGMVDDLLTGFWCEVDGDDTIRMDASELKFASWVKREDIVLQPDDYSLTNEMMTRFQQGRENEDVVHIDRSYYYQGSDKPKE